jgi:hypothetical protein
MLRPLSSTNQSDLDTVWNHENSVLPLGQVTGLQAANYVKIQLIASFKHQDE